MSLIKGYFFERRAEQYLKQHGLKTLTRNFHSPMGEIDLIMQDKTNLIFIEVRYRRHSDQGSALESIDHFKQQALIKTAQYFIAQNKCYQHCISRFDVIAIDGKHPYGLEWIQNAIEET